MSIRSPLSSVLPTNPDDDNNVTAAFDSTTAAENFTPIPRGVYVAVAIEGGLSESRAGTKGYRVVFRVTEGEFTGRRLWRTWYLTPAAMQYSKRDLLKLGIDSGAKLHQPLPSERFVVRLTVTLRTLDDGTNGNEVKGMELIRIDEPKPDPFAPSREMTIDEFLESLGSSSSNSETQT